MVRTEFHIAQIVHELERHELLPAIVFRTSRSQCDMDAQRASTNRGLRLSPQRQRELKVRVHEIVKQYDMELELITSHPHYSGLILTGIGAHHAGQLLMWRLLLEELMASGLLRVLVATGTVAAGVDFPARTVIITAHSRRGSDGFRSLSAAEFQQMSGRAGRRGRDAVGFCIAVPTPFCDARAVLKISKQPAEPLVSAYFPSPSTVLNLMRYRNADDLTYTVERSLASYVDRREAKRIRKEAENALQGLPDRCAVDSLEEEPEEEEQTLTKEQKKLAKRVRRLRRQATEMEQRQTSMLRATLGGLAALGYLEGSSLSPKGYWAANLCTGIVLELAELIEAGVFAGASAERLVATIASISGDEHRQYLDTKNPPISSEDIAKIEELTGRVGKQGMPGVAPALKALPSAANTVLVWMLTESWQTYRALLSFGNVAEGDAARLITQTADHLNQLTRLSETHPELALRAEEAKRRILRPPLSEAINLETL